MSAATTTTGANGAPVVKRTGLHKLRCHDCDLSAYVTFAQLEARALPACRCGLELLPERLDVALAVESLGLEDLARHPAYLEYERQTNRVAHGQGRADGYGHNQRRLGRGALRSPEAVALARVVDSQRAEMALRRVAGLVQNAARAAAADEIPF